MNIDDYEALPTTSVATNMMAGAIAGVLEHCVMYPLDSVKTRMQSLSPLTRGQTISSTMMEMINKEGLLRPLRGVGAVVAGAGPAHAMYFSSYEFSKEWFAKVNPNNPINYSMAAIVATLIHDAISNPTEVIKQRLQMYNSRYRSVVHCMSTVYRQEGLRAFYRSYATQLVMNLPYQTIHFSTYEFMQSTFNKDRKYNPPVHMVAGAFAGATAAAVTTPLDVMKTLLNTQETGIGQTRGMWQAAAKINETAGIRGFFKGMVARVLYSMPATAICWSTYEFFKYIIERRGQELNMKPPPVSGGSSSAASCNSVSSSSSSGSSSTAGSGTPQCKRSITEGAKGTGTVAPAAKDGIFVIPAATAHHAVAAETNTASLKPRELPAMSGAGMYGAMQYNTIHSVGADSSRSN